jgi:predicted transposase YdaD
VGDLDFTRCETLDKSFVADHYKETESDLIYKVGLRGQTIYIYILIEFQSSVGRFMAVRVLNYITSF